MKVLSDIHHEELFESLRILFEDRLEYELYRPIGIDWWINNYWCVGNHLDKEKQRSAAIQFLIPNSDIYFRPLEKGERLVGDSLLIYKESTPYLRYVNLCEKEQDYSCGYANLKSPVYPNKRYRGVTLECFKNTKFDILVCSVPEHIDGFLDLIKKYQPHAKLIFQAGNPWLPPEDKVKNILTSTAETQSKKVNCVYYHQEFDLDMWTPDFEKKIPSIFSMMHYLQDYDIFFDLEKEMPDFSFHLYGAGCKHGVPGPNMQDIVDIYKKNTFLWHVKKEGEGYGYNIHHAIAMGIPTILRRKYFHGQTVDLLLEDGISCIDLDKIESTKNVKKRIYDALFNYDEFSRKTINRFKNIVNFDEEEIQIRKFLERLT